MHLLLMIGMLGCRLKEFIKDQLVSIPTPIAIRPTQLAPASPVAQPSSAPASLTDPGAMLAALL